MSCSKNSKYFLIFTQIIFTPILSFSTIFAEEIDANDPACFFEVYEGRLHKMNLLEKNIVNAEQGREAQELAEKNLDTMGCKRLFLYRGILQPVDSFQKRDGEKLRLVFTGERHTLNSVKSENLKSSSERIPILSTESLEYLNTYQMNRRRVQNAAYISTTGIVLMLISVFAGTELKSSGKAVLDNIFFYGGAGLAASGVGYSMWVLSNNENNLVKAVDSFNKKNPEDKIELKFSAGFVF